MPRVLRGILQATSASHGWHFSVSQLPAHFKTKVAVTTNSEHGRKTPKSATKQNKTKQTSYTVHMQFIPTYATSPSPAALYCPSQFIVSHPHSFNSRPVAYRLLPRPSLWYKYEAKHSTFDTSGFPQVLR